MKLNFYDKLMQWHEKRGFNLHYNCSVVSAPVRDYIENLEAVVRVYKIAVWVLIIILSARLIMDWRWG